MPDARLTEDLFKLQQQMNDIEDPNLTINLTTERSSRLLGLITKIHNSIPESSRNLTFTAAENRLYGRVTAGHLTPREDASDLQQITIAYLRTCDDTTIERFLGLGDSWITEGNKALAKEKIIRCFRNNSTDLVLRSLYLSSLPPRLFHYLPQLTTLSLSCNKLQALPDLSNLVKMKRLDLASNKLQEVRGLSNLVKLRHINLANNKFQEVPTGLLRDRTIIITNNPSSSPQEPLDPTIESFKKKLSNTSKFKNFNANSLKKEDPVLFGKITDFLKKLNGTGGKRYPAVAEFRSKNKQVHNAFAEKVLFIVDLASRKPGFRPILEDALSVAATDCQDKAAYYLNSAEVQSRIFEKKDEPAGSLFPILRRDFILKLIENEFLPPILKRTSSKEDVETALHLQINLLDNLTSQTIAYSPCSSATEEDISQAKTTLQNILSTNTRFIDYLSLERPSELSVPYLWQEKLKKDFRPEFDEILGRFSQEIEQVMKKEASDTQNPGIQSELVEPITEIMTRKATEEQAWIRGKTETLLLESLLSEQERSATSAIANLRVISVPSASTETNPLAKRIQEVIRKYDSELSEIKNKPTNEQIAWYTSINNEMQSIKNETQFPALLLERTKSQLTSVLPDLRVISVPLTSTETNPLAKRIQEVIRKYDSELSEIKNKPTNEQIEWYTSINNEMQSIKNETQFPALLLLERTKSQLTSVLPNLRVISDIRGLSLREANTLLTRIRAVVHKYDSELSEIQNKPIDDQTEWFTTINNEIQSIKNAPVFQELLLEEKKITAASAISDLRYLSTLIPQTFYETNPLAKRIKEVIDKYNERNRGIQDLPNAEQIEWYTSINNEMQSTKSDPDFPKLLLERTQALINSALPNLRVISDIRDPSLREADSQLLNRTREVLEQYDSELSEVQNKPIDDQIKWFTPISKEIGIITKNTQLSKLLLDGKKSEVASALFALKAVSGTIHFYTKHVETRELDTRIKEVLSRYESEKSEIIDERTRKQIAWIDSINNEIHEITTGLLNHPKNVSRKRIFEEAQENWNRLHPRS